MQGHRVSLQFLIFLEFVIARGSIHILNSSLVGVVVII